MPNIGFVCDGGTPTLAVWLEGNGLGVQRFYCENPFWIIFKDEANPWPGEGKGGGPGGTGPGFVNAQEYYSGDPVPVGGKASIMLRLGDPTDGGRKGIYPLADDYKFSVRIQGCPNDWDPRVIPD